MLITWKTINKGFESSKCLEIINWEIKGCNAKPANVKDVII